MNDEGSICFARRPQTACSSCTSEQRRFFFLFLASFMYLSQNSIEAPGEIAAASDKEEVFSPARSKATGVSRNSLTVPSPPHDSAPPSSARIFATPMYNTLEPPPRGARNVWRSCAARCCCRCNPVLALHTRMSPSRQPETSKLPAPDPGPNRRRRCGGGAITAREVTAVVCPWPLPSSLCATLRRRTPRP